MQRVINNDLQPVVLDDGTIIPAAGTGAQTHDVELSERDHARHVERGRLTILEARDAVATQSESLLDIEKERE